MSAKEEKIPDLPVVALAQDEVTLQRRAAQCARAAVRRQILQADDWQRWNDYGIGLFLQGDLKGAQAAFGKVTEIDPQNPDGWVNIGRAAVQEGDMDRARTVLEKALALSPDLARAHFFYAKVLRSDGNYDGAAEHLRKVLAQYPRDRVALNDLGRILFLQRKYADAVKVLESVLAVDPEDLQAHYNLMLCYNGLGDEKQAHEHQVRYLRFKADEVCAGHHRPLPPAQSRRQQRAPGDSRARFGAAASEHRRNRPAASWPVSQPGGSTRSSRHRQSDSSAGGRPNNAQDSSLLSCLPG